MRDDVTKRLEKLGLGQFASSFFRNHIDTQLLSQLTGDDLKELGVGSLTAFVHAKELGGS